MTPPAVLAIDQGTTSTRAFLLDAGGDLRPLHARRHRQHRPAPGRVEHDPGELLADLSACLEAAQAAGPVAAVGLDNQGESCLGWDARTGEPVCPVLVWQDARTEADCARLRAAGAEPLSLARAGVPLDPYFSASKLGWILREIPEAAALHRGGRLRLGTTDAFFRDRLGGRFETDPTTASRTGLMDLARLDWDAELCALHGVPPECLPAIRPSTGDLGPLGPLPLTASLVDQQAATWGHGCRRPGETKITFGTGAFALALLGDSLPADRRGCLLTVAWARAGEPPVYALEGGVYAAGAALDWAQGLGLWRDTADLALPAGPPAIARGVAFVPALSGLACPHWNRQARGAWLGLDLATGRADLVAALLEGIAFRAAEVLEAMEGAAPLREPVSVDGGLSANPAFLRLLAGALGRPVRVSPEPELTARGIAALAAEAVGLAPPDPPLGQPVDPPATEPLHAFRDRFAAARAAVEGYGRALAAAGGRSAPT
ncbi:FGGY family carbohydrate kinase [Rubellimicrobium sp. CFH 75288]|uniref:FGGY family carbohydrate kinase n=1 Tax=Rubellimicrobium sp. CFH 75288 TaxID=2697034 RepID=UPI0014135442|nr:FGGY family carbohydrate kinase [Rubellimicrobium sp. CFH 75288]NAZ37552.1 glycerol kinase [Rubellimicrobium sp. CFH 75288]